MPKKFWQFRNQAEGSAELLLYGDISEKSWWGDNVTPKQFADDLNALGTVSDISVRINSGGGDVFAAQAIGNLLEQNPAKVTAYIDGLCASAATVVACHCDRVVAANDSTYMIHPVKMGVYDYVDSTVLNQCISALAAIRDNIVSLYARKTGRDKEEVAGWMDATSWWTGEQAKEKGFVDELVIDSSEPSEYENRGGVLFINSVSMSLPFDEAPAFIRNHTKPEIVKEDAKVEIKNTDDLRREYPELVSQVEQAAAKTAAEQERVRISRIEDMALPRSEELTAKAKFSEPLTPEQYAVEMIKCVKTQGAAYLDKMAEDAETGGVNQIGSAPAPVPGSQDDKDSVAAAVAQAKKDAAAFLNKAAAK